METLLAVLKHDNVDARVTVGDKWLAWDGQWVVYYHPRHARKTREIYRGDGIELACVTLLEDDR